MTALESAPILGYGRECLASTHRVWAIAVVVLEPARLPDVRAAWREAEVAYEFKYGAARRFLSALARKIFSHQRQARLTVLFPRTPGKVCDGRDGACRFRCSCFIQSSSWRFSADARDGTQSAKESDALPVSPFSTVKVTLACPHRMGLFGQCALGEASSKDFAPISPQLAWIGHRDGFSPDPNSMRLSR